MDISRTVASVPGDPEDHFVLATLIAGKAKCLVTGDTDLLARRDRYPVLLPAEFSQRLSPARAASPL